MRRLVSADTLQCLEEETKRVDKLLNKPKEVFKDDEKRFVRNEDYFGDYKEAEMYGFENAFVDVGVDVAVNLTESKSIEISRFRVKKKRKNYAEKKKGASTP